MFSRPQRQSGQDTHPNQKISVSLPWEVFTSITWPTFPTSSAQQDTPVTGITDPVSVPAAAGSYNTVVRKSGDCTWTDATDTLSFSGTTECIHYRHGHRRQHIKPSPRISVPLPREFSPPSIGRPSRLQPPKRILP